MYEPPKLPGKKLRMSSNWKSKPPFILCAPRAQVMRVGHLPALDRRLARAERVAADGQHESCRRSGGVASGIVAVGEAGLAVARDWKRTSLNSARAEHRRHARVERARIDVRVAGVLLRHVRAAVFEVLAGEVLMVVAQRQAVGAGELMIGLDQEHVLILAALPALGERTQAIDGRERRGSVGAFAGTLRNTVFGVVLRWPS